MKPTLEYLSVEFGLAPEELTMWVERRWIRPGRSDGELSFSAADVARLRMITEFHRDLAIDDETMPVVLDLVDRLHAARAQLKDILQAIAELPEPTRLRILRRLQGKGSA